MNKSNFICKWSTGKDSFAVYTPIAVLVVEKQEEKMEILIVELFNTVNNLDKYTGI